MVTFSASNIDYIKPKNAFSILTDARRTGKTVFISGMTGFGKTELTRQFFGEKGALYYSPLNNDIGERTSIDFSSIPQSTKRKTPLPVVVDDLQFLLNEDSRTALCKLLDRTDLFLILIARPTVLEWLNVRLCTKPYSAIGEEDLAIDKEGAKEIFDSEKIALSDEQLQKVVFLTKGNAYGIKASAALLKTAPFGSDFKERIIRFYSQYCMNTILSEWSDEPKIFMAKMSVAESFSAESAKAITGNPDIENMIDTVRNLGNIFFEKDGVYTIRPIPLRCFQKFAAIKLGEQKIKEIAFKAAEFAENNGETEKAIALFKKAERRDRVFSLLEKNAHNNPAHGHFHALKPYYFALSEEEVLSSVDLISCLSMIYSMNFQKEKSEYYYNKLCEKAKSGANALEKKRAKVLISYLDIALPHRGSTGVLRTIKNIANLLLSGDIMLPEFSMTSNLPSIMNGGKDFCRWSQKDKEIAKNYGSLVSFALGKNGKGLVHLALGESFFEKAQDDAAVQNHLTQGLMEAYAAENLETAFSATGVLSRFYAATGQLELARNQIAIFENRLGDKNSEIKENLLAVKARLSLLENDMTAVNHWLIFAPDEGQNTSAMLRYQYLTKIRAYIAKGENAKASALNERMTWYAENYERIYIKIECGILSAILQEKNGDEIWKDTLFKALCEAKDFNFVRVFSEEGAAIYPLLRHFAKDSAAQKTIGSPYFSRILEESEKQAHLYPNYLGSAPIAETKFSPLSIKILSLQAQGLSAKEIASALNMKTETIRYHIKTNYKKLDAANKAEAIISAREQHLI